MSVATVVFVLPCPFCGCKDPKIENETECFGHGDYRSYTYICCPECRVKMPAEYADDKATAVASAVEKWNTRNGILWNTSNGTLWGQQKEKQCQS